MKYSIVITYRDRESHLVRLLPRLVEKYENMINYKLKQIERKKS